MHYNLMSTVIVAIDSKTIWNRFSELILIMIGNAEYIQGRHCFSPNILALNSFFIQPSRGSVNISIWH